MLGFTEDSEGTVRDEWIVECRKKGYDKFSVALKGILSEKICNRQNKRKTLLLGYNCFHTGVKLCCSDEIPTEND